MHRRVAQARPTPCERVAPSPGLDIDSLPTGTLLMLPVAPEGSSLVSVREQIRRTFGSSLPVGDELILAFVATELLSNAILHGREPIRLMVHVDHGRALVAAHDGNGDPLPLPHGAPYRGLTTIDIISRGSWGTIPSGSGKWVAASLALEAPLQT
jgi:hypothetical protein